ncbi:MAG: hypothetical protein K2Q13_10165 [Nitrosomonas sp.]|uniref:hypothetical protein n=1 Tax=Nitrosomonas sp. TaxID=42353 RepID=UPI0025EBFC85|nr:hypothetical protein [Nitrosomonas sp.]MBY0475406.1 hypothetical protein [Nitrosomonas sp.]
MTTTFVRQLGSESGVQLNPLRDNSEVPSQDNQDQLFGIMMRSARGRIDKPFKVDRGNALRKLGKGDLIRTSALNEAWVHVIEALNNGAYEAVVQRLVTDAAQLKWAVITASTDTPVYATSNKAATLTAIVNAGEVTSVTVVDGGRDFDGTETITVGGPGAGAILTPVLTDGVVTSVTVTEGGTGYTTAPTLTCLPVSGVPLDDYFMAVKHLECFNDGIIVEYRADEKKTGGSAVDNDFITLRIRDKSGVMIHEFTGSLDDEAVDDFGGSAYLPDVISAQTDLIEVLVGVTGASAVVEPSSDAYGYDTSGLEKWSKSAVLTCFVEGGTAYANDDYVAARQKLQYTPFNYTYISSGGSQSAALLGQLAQLSFDTNRQLRFDVPGNLNPAAAIAFVEQLNLGANQASHLIHAFWAPVKSNDPAGVNPNGYFGTATLNIAYACGRNAQTDSRGFAPKNYPVANKNWPIRRSRMVQTYSPSNQELNALANAKINPVTWEVFSGGGLFVFRDSLTSAPVKDSLRKLISTADMASSIDDAVTRLGKDVLQLPMQIALKRLKNALTQLFEGAVASEWLVPSNDPGMDGQAWRFEVVPNETHPYDRIDCSYWLRYDGVARQIFVTQTLTR